METRSSLRNKLKSGFCTVIDKNIIKWKPLSIQDYFYYDDLSKNGDIAPVVLEDEIFLKCVTDKNYTDNIDNLPFGTVGIVVQNIMEHSGPLSIDHFNNLLDQNRAIAQQPLHHLVTLIVRAFPAYKPEDIYAMPFETFMLRIAQAESLLMMLGIIQEPIQLVDENAPKKQPQKRIPKDLKRLFDKQQEDMKKPPAPKKAPVKKESGQGVKFDKVDMDPKKSPIFNKDTKHPEFKPLGNLDVERIASERAMQTEEESAERARMVKEAQIKYKDLLKELEEKKKSKAK